MCLLFVYVKLDKKNLKPKIPQLNFLPTTQPNLPDIVFFGPYHPHGFVLGSHAWPQDMFVKLVTSTINKANYQLLTRRCEILQSTPFKEPNDPVGTFRQLVRLALIPNVTAWPNLPNIIRFGPYCPYKFVLGSYT